MPKSHLLSYSPTSCCCYTATSQQLAHPPPAPLPRDASAASSNGCRLSIKRRPSLQGRRREQTTALGFRRRFGALLILSRVSFWQKNERTSSSESLDFEGQDQKPISIGPRINNNKMVSSRNWQKLFLFFHFVISAFSISD